MKDSKFWFQISKLNGLSRILVFPMFFIATILLLSSQLIQKRPVYFEIPVIIVYCNEREFQTPADRARALQNHDVPMARCQEKVTWQGDDRESIDSLAYTKAEEILNSLYATPQNPALVRESAAKVLEYFEEGSVAKGTYKRKIEETINKAASYAATFKATSSYVRFVEDEKNPDGNRWVVKISGIWITEADTQKGHDVTLMLSFKPTRKEERKNSQQSIIVTLMEMTVDGK